MTSEKMIGILKTMLNNELSKYEKEYGIIDGNIPESAYSALSRLNEGMYWAYLNIHDTIKNMEGEYSD